MERLHLFPHCQGLRLCGGSSTDHCTTVLVHGSRILPTCLVSPIIDFGLDQLCAMCVAQARRLTTRDDWSDSCRTWQGHG